MHMTGTVSARLMVLHLPPARSQSQIMVFLEDSGSPVLLWEDDSSQDSERVHTDPKNVHKIRVGSGACSIM